MPAITSYAHFPAFVSLPLSKLRLGFLDQLG